MYEEILQLLTGHVLEALRGLSREDQIAILNRSIQISERSQRSYKTFVSTARDEYLATKSIIEQWKQSQRNKIINRPQNDSEPDTINDLVLFNTVTLHRCLRR